MKITLLKIFNITIIFKNKSPEKPILKIIQNPRLK